MASVYIWTTPHSVIDYSCVDGRVRCFVKNGKTIYDEDINVVKIGWKYLLATFVMEHGLDKDDGHGLHAFVYRMFDDGLLPQREQ
jgi:hypothetical protein